MRKNSICVLLIFLAISCKNYKDVIKHNKIKNNTMEHFDKQRFEENKNNNEYKIYSNDGTEIKQISGGELAGKNTIIEETKKQNSLYTTYKVFFYDKGSLKQTGEMFYNFPIEIWKEYNEKGFYIKEIDYEKSYKFSINDLQKKIKKEFGIDIMEKKVGVSVSRNIDLPPQYNVRLPLIENYSGSWKTILVDGVTGDIISENMGKRTK